MPSWIREIKSNPHGTRSPSEPEQELLHMRNTYAARESAHRFATCLPDGRQLPPASHALLRRASCRLRHNHPDLASRPNSPFPSFQRQSDTFSFLEPRLLPYAVQSAGTKVVARFTRHSNYSRLARMFVLPMASPRAIKAPSASFQFLDHISHFHFTLCCKASSVNRNPVHDVRRVQHGFG